MGKGHQKVQNISLIKKGSTQSLVEIGFDWTSGKENDQSFEMEND